MTRACAPSSNSSPFAPSPCSSSEERLSTPGGQAFLPQIVNITPFLGILIVLAALEETGTNRPFDNIVTCTLQDLGIPQAV